MLEKEYNYFLSIRDKLVEEHLNEFVVIKNNTIIGYYLTEKEAIENTVNEELGTFLIKQCTPDDQDIQKYHSRAVFV